MLLVKTKSISGWVKTFVAGQEVKG